MTTRLATQVFIGLLLASVVPITAQEHPRPPQQAQSQQPPQTTTGSTRAATMQASTAEISAGLKKFISSYAAKSADRKFHMPYQGKDLALDLVKLHEDR